MAAPVEKMKAPGFPGAGLFGLTVLQDALNAPAGNFRGIGNNGDIGGRIGWSFY